MGWYWGARPPPTGESRAARGAPNGRDDTRRVGRAGRRLRRRARPRAHRPGGPRGVAGRDHAAAAARPGAGARHSRPTYYRYPQLNAANAGGKKTTPTTKTLQRNPGQELRLSASRAARATPLGRPVPHPPRRQPAGGAGAAGSACWSTGGGLSAAQVTALVRACRQEADIVPLTDPALWGRASTTSPTSCSAAADPVAGQGSASCPGPAGWGPSRPCTW